MGFVNITMQCDDAKMTICRPDTSGINHLKSSNSRSTIGPWLWGSQKNWQTTSQSSSVNPSSSTFC